MISSWIGNSQFEISPALPGTPAPSQFIPPVLKLSDFETSAPSGYPIYGSATLENAVGMVNYSLFNSTCPGLTIDVSSGVVNGEFGGQSGFNCSYQIRATNGSNQYDSAVLTASTTSGLTLSFSESGVTVEKGGSPKTVYLNLSSAAPFSTKLKYRLYSIQNAPTALYGFDSTGTIDIAAGATSVPIVLEFKSSAALATNDSQVLRIESGAGSVLPSLSIRLAVNATPAVSKVCSGDMHSCAIADGKLYCWGYNGASQIGIASFNDSQKTPLQIGTSNTWQDLSCGGSHTCGIDGGKLYCWGAPGEQLGIGATAWTPGPIQVGSSSTWQSISAGNSHTCGIDGGSLYCWGIGGVGQVGSGVASTGYRPNTPVHIGSSTTWTSVAAGYNETCGINAGRLYCWGFDHVGQQGNGSGSSATVYSPVQIGSQTNWQFISMSHLTSGFACGIESGRLYCWGSDFYGVLGNGSASSANVTSPEQIGTDTTWTYVRNGKDSTCGINAGRLYCWGNNNYSILGVPLSITDTSSPIQVGTATDWTSISPGSLHICGLRGINLYCWGTNTSHGKGLGLATPTSVPTPTLVGSSTDWEDVKTSSGVSSGIRSGNLYSWGHNSFHRLGIGSSKSLYNYESVPVRMGLGNQWSYLTSGESHSCAIQAGKLYCWGRNNYYQTGDGTTSAFSGTSLPTRVGTLETWSAIANGTYHSCGIAAGELYCWGMDAYGQVGNGAAASTTVTSPEKIGSSNSWTFVSAGGSHTCGINGGQLYCWGYDNRGQQGNGAGSTANVHSPTLVDASTNWQFLTSGGAFNCGIKGGALFCWGQDPGGGADIDTPTQIGSSTAWITAGASSNGICGIDNGSLYCWGKNEYGQMGTGAVGGVVATPTRVGSLTNWQKVSNGYSHTCGIESGRMYCWGSNLEMQLGSNIISNFPIQVVDF